jgi:UbiD family decarboxylase
MYYDLKSFILALKKAGEIQEITVPVDPSLEAAEIHRRTISAGGPALIFRSIKGSSYPLVTNLFGTKKRIELAFGPKPEQFIRSLTQLATSPLPPSLNTLWRTRNVFGSLARMAIPTSRTNSVFECVQTPPRLNELPLLKTWKLDGGEFITLPLVQTADPETKIPNLGMYRMQRYDDTSTGMHMQIGKGGGFHLKRAEELGQPLDVVAYIGGPPAMILSAIAPLPENVPELLLTSLLLERKAPFVRSAHSPLPIYALSEFALIGTVNAHDIRPEGPFGDHYGYYSLQHDYPVFRCKTLLHRKDPICAATVVGKPRQEDFFLGDYLQKLLSPLFPLVMPSVSDLWSYGETGYHSLSAAVVKQRYKREAMVSAFRILGEGQLSLTKFLLLTDKPQDLTDFRSLLRYILERADFRTDLYVFSNLSMDTLDYTGPTINSGSKGVLLGVGDPIRSLPHSFNQTLPRSLRHAQVFCPGCLVVDGRSAAEEPELASQLASESCFREWPLVVLVDNAQKTVATPSSFLWTVFTRFEPGADIYASGKSVVRNHLSYTPPIIIDSRMKAGYPDELECDPDTQALVDARWNHYFKV